jgi:hypothetical protein
MDDRLTTRTIRRRGPRLAAGLVMITASVAGIAVGWRGAGAAEVEERAVIARQAYFTHPATEALPPVLLNGFPPSTVCLVAGLVGVPQVCGPDIRDILDTLGLGDGLPVPPTPDADIVQAVVPGTTPVGMLGGQQRYASLFQFLIPTLPDGEEFARFELILHESGINYALESPAFRQAVLAALLQVEDPDPTVFADLLDNIASGATPLVAQTVTGIEACPAIEPWNGGDAQNAALEGTRLPDVNCLVGTTGVFDPAAKTWTFDLTFAVEAWTTGTPDGGVLPNEGIVLRPVGAPNVAYGDPDLSTNFQISLGDAEAPEGLVPMVRYSTKSTAPPAPPPAPSGGSTFTPSPGIISSTGSGGSPAPAVVAPPAAFGPLSARWAERDISAGKGDMPGAVWLLVPLGLGGGLLLGESLLVDTIAMRRRPGAMSRLMRVRGVTDADLTGGIE